MTLSPYLGLDNVSTGPVNADVVYLPYHIVILYILSSVPILYV
jgi:hypothetical protein